MTYPSDLVDGFAMRAPYVDPWHQAPIEQVASLPSWSITAKALDLARDPRCPPLSSASRAWAAEGGPPLAYPANVRR